MVGFKRQRSCTCCRDKYDPSQMLLSMWLDRSMEYGLYDFLYVNHENTELTQLLERKVAGEVALLAKTRIRQVAKYQDNTRRLSQMAKIAPFEKKELKLGRLLGRGGFSKVYEIISINPDNELERRFNGNQKEVRDALSSSALKTVKSFRGAYGRNNTTADISIGRYAIKHLKHQLLGSPQKFAKAAIDLANEAQMLLYLDHPHIVKLQGLSAAGTCAFKSGTHDDYFLVMDRLVDTLEDRIWLWRNQWKNLNGRRIKHVVCKLTKKLLCFPEEGEDASHRLMVRRLRIAHDISDAIEYLHSQRIISRDIKTTNIGFDLNGDAKLFDFGLSRFLPKGKLDENFLLSNVGTRSYMAPEISQKMPYNQSADIYSFGVVMWEMFSLRSPKRQKAFKRLLPCDCWPLDLQELVSSMIDYDPSVRPGANEVVNSLRNVLLDESDQETSNEILKKYGDKLRSRSSRTVTSGLSLVQNSDTSVISGSCASAVLSA